MKGNILRVEVSLKSLDRFKMQIRCLRSIPDVTAVNIAHKSKGDDLLGAVEILKKDMPFVKDICVHVSIKNLYEKNEHVTYQKMVSLLTDLKRMATEGIDRSLSVLIVSGGGKLKRKLNTVSALRRMREDIGGDFQSMDVAVAFNPYLPSEEERLHEYHRLREKFQAMPNICAVYLQLGTDFELLETGLKELEKLKIELKLNFQVYGSVFIPDKKFLVSMMFRPWSGVHLCEEYLSDVAHAEKITKKLVGIYRNMNVTPLIETEIMTRDEFEKACNFF